MAAKKPAAKPITPDPLDRLLDEVGAEKAIEFYERLPEAIARHIHRIATEPTPAEVARLNASFTKWYPSVRPMVNAAIARVNESRLILLEGGVDSETA